jgi:hypothetical protein
MPPKQSRPKGRKPSPASLSKYPYKCPVHRQSWSFQSGLANHLRDVHTLALQRGVPCRNWLVLPSTIPDFNSVPFPGPAGGPPGGLPALLSQRRVHSRRSGASRIRLCRRSDWLNGKYRLGRSVYGKKSKIEGKQKKWGSKATVATNIRRACSCRPRINESQLTRAISRSRL